MTYPVRSVTRPAVLMGQRNGLLASSILTSVPGQAGGLDVLLVDPAARAWRALTAAALADGHVLKLSGAHCAYRPYAIQERIFRDRYVTTYLPGRPSKVWNGVRWWQRPGTAVAAVPGTSNHGWGLAVDTGEERDSDLAAEPLDDGTLRWLLANEERFGWSHEVQSEPWHLRYFAGDRIPQAVLDHEHTTTPPNPTEEVDVIWHIKDSPYTFLHLGGRDFLPLTEDTFWALAGQGVKVVTVTNDLFQAKAAVKGQGSLLHGKAYG